MIEDILKKRTNCSFFREDKIPDKKQILFAKRWCKDYDIRINNRCIYL